MPITHKPLLMPAHIAVGEVFRVARNDVSHGFRSYVELTQGRFGKGADVNKGMFFYQSVREPNLGIQRVPAFIFHSNPLKKGSDETPWVDVVEPDLGYALYHGDNKSSARHPLAARGNSKFAEVQATYSDPSLRVFAPPILLFTQRNIDGNRKGYREFSGYGVPLHCSLTTQREQSSERYFSNVTVEIALFRLDEENELFDWRWIDARRDPRISAQESLSFAPSAWKHWVKRGNDEVENCRRRVARHFVERVRAQCEMSGTEQRIISEVQDFFAHDKHPFEGLASFIASRILGPRCKRGWVTKRSGDGGIDFISRLDVGDESQVLSRTPLVVLGQAKCQKNPISGRDLARVVARLQRGWIGVFVTTGTYSEACQQELIEDKYPLLLINGKRLAREIHAVVVNEGLSVTSLCERETAWYASHQLQLSPSRILENSSWNSKYRVAAT